MNNLSAGRKVYISISDPWDFVTNNGEYRTGTISTNAGMPLDSLEIHLDNPVEALGLITDKVFAHSRHTDRPLSNLTAGTLVPCNFTYEGIGFIGALKLV